jgi:hypothetical protein
MKAFSGTVQLIMRKKDLKVAFRLKMFFNNNPVSWKEKNQ